MQQADVWDFPTRLFHWLLVAALIFQYVSGEILDDAMQWHFYIGYFTIGLIVFRLLWGFVGHTHSRFSQFIVGPGRVVNYVKGQDSQHYLTHNPLGALSVIAILAIVATQAISGLFIDDDIFFQGPWYAAVDKDTVSLANTIHHTFYKVIIGLAILHIIAIGFYQRVKKQAIVQSMIHGKKPTQKAHAYPTFSRSLVWRFLIVVAISAAIVYLGVEVLSPEPVEEFFGF
ncbi:cytochrome b/b6 domain-containing protein [Glaciecola sp. 1036]|uniref:cytochrome b/b6 domain-containing protein n=1 Tax=Alteromonadaceae TaxID=72275 RepID=UPI003D0138D5